MICKVCASPFKEDLEKDFVMNRLSKQKLSNKYGLPYGSVDRHLRNHLPQELAEAAKEREREGGGAILDSIQGLVQSAQNQLSKAEKKGHGRLALESVRTLKDLYQLLLQIQVKLQEMENQRANSPSIGEDGHLSREQLGRLNSKEMDVYFQLNRKLLGDTHVDIFPDYEQIEAVFTNDEQDTSEEDEPIKRTRKRKTAEPEPDIDTDTFDTNSMDQKNKRRTHWVQKPPDIVRR